MRGFRLLLLLLYVLSSLPVVASYHYCLGRVKEISFYDENTLNCVCLGDEDYSDCCDTEHSILDFQDDHTENAKVAFAKVFSNQFASVFATERYTLPQTTKKAIDSRGPPVACKLQDIYLAHCNFRL